MTTAETNTETGTPDVLQQIAAALGDGWTAQGNHAADGYLAGPEGLRLWLDARRAFGIYGEVGGEATAYLQRRTHPDEVTDLRYTRAEGDDLGALVAALQAILPQWQQAHREDLARCAASMAESHLFAAEVANHLGVEWEGGCEDQGGGDRLGPVSYVQHDRERVEWLPLQWNWGAPGQPGAFRPVEVIRLQGKRETAWPARTREDNPSANVNSTRGAKAVASAIRTRILPGYRAAMAAADAEDARHEQAEQGAAAMAVIVRQALGQLVRYSYTPSSNTESEVVRIDDGELCISGEVTCSEYTATVKMEAYRMTAPQAKAILGALAKAISREREKADAATAGGNE